MFIRRNSPTNIRLKAGFTIVELLVVVIVIAIIATVTVITYSGVSSRATDAGIAAELTQAAKELEQEKIKNGQYPGDMEGLVAGRHIQGPPGGSDFTIQYDTDDQGDTFCITGIKDDKVFRLTNGGRVEEGLCAGHTGPDGEGGAIVANCPSGFIPVPGNPLFGTSDFCVMKYEAKLVNDTPVSTIEGVPYVLTSGNLADIKTLAAKTCQTCRLITNEEWLTIAHDILNVDSNWTGGSVGQGMIYTGNRYSSDIQDDVDASTHLEAGEDEDGYHGIANVVNEKRRTLTLSNGQVIWDFSGNVAEVIDLPVAGSMEPPFVQPTIGHTTVEYPSLPVGNLGILPSNIIPSYGSPHASGWDSSRGIGNLSNENYNTERTERMPFTEDTVVARGGDAVGALTEAGILAIYIGVVSSICCGGVAGFRVTA